MGILLLPSNSPAERGAHLFFPVLDKSYHLVEDLLKFYCLLWQSSEGRGIKNLHVKIFSDSVS